MREERHRCAAQPRREVPPIVQYAERLSGNGQQQAAYATVVALHAAGGAGGPVPREIWMSGRLCTCRARFVIVCCCHLAGMLTDSGGRAGGSIPPSLLVPVLAGFVRR